MIKLNNVTNAFAPGTVVGAYVGARYNAGDPSPIGDVLEEAAVQPDGSLTFGTLPQDGTTYVAAAEIDDLWRVMRFTTAVPTGMSPGEVLAELEQHEAETTGAHGGIVAGDDPRLDDAREPLPHAASHYTDGDDPLDPALIGAVPVNTLYIDPTSPAYGAVGNGVTDDTEALQAAITDSVSQRIPLYLPAGEYRVTDTLVAKASNFCMVGAGMRVSQLVADGADFDVIVIGPGPEGSGNVPGGYVRDCSIKGGGPEAEIDALGVAPTTETAAWKLSGMRLFEFTNVGVMEGEFDIGFDLVDNSFGVIMNNCRVDFEVCRVALNIRTDVESGNDHNYNGCWFSGEVACVHISGNAGGFHFHGGQLNVNRLGEVDDDDRGAIVIGKDYTSQSTAGDTVNVSFDGLDMEECQRAWFVRGYGQNSLALRDCAFLANGPSPSIGVYKNSSYENSRTLLENNRVKGTFVVPAAELATIEGGFGGRTWVEIATSGGGVDVEGGVDSTNVDDAPLALLAEMDFAFAVSPEWTLATRELLIRNEAGDLEISTDWGETWTTPGGAPPVTSVNGETGDVEGLEEVANKDTDATLAANSDVKYPSQKAIKAYVDGLLAASDAVVYKGAKDCSASPNYPAASAGHLYAVSVAGKIGGAAGIEVEAGDLIICKVDGSAEGNQAAVGANWNVIQTNIVGAVTGPAAATADHIPQFNGTSGKVLKDGLALDTDGTLAANSDTRLPSQKAVKTAIAASTIEIEDRTFAIVPTATTLGGFYLRIPAGETAKLIGIRYKIAAGSCKLKVKRTTSGGATSEPTKEKEAKAEVAETALETELADKDLLELIAESVTTPGLLYATLFIERKR